MTELIERKNNLLKQAGDDLVKIAALGSVCENVEFSKASAATAFIRLVGDAIGRLTLNRYEILHAANISLPEAEQGAEDGN